jgi:RNA polymerase sigma-70 factor (ECF subfamily)
VIKEGHPPANFVQEISESVLHSVYAKGHAAWPDLHADRDGFARHFAALAQTEGKAELPAADMYLAWACTCSVPGALEAFDRTFMQRVGLYIARMNPSAAFVEEVRQTVRERLFVGTAQTRPKIADFAGRGPLEGWVRVITLRTAVDLLRKQGKELPAPAVETAHVDPELELIRRKYAPQFKQAFESALSSLSSEHRHLLRMHFVDSLTLDELASVFRVHRVTVAKRLAAARHAILDEACRLLVQQLTLSPTECQSLLGLVRSQIDVSIFRLLQ